jgi:hypothetical protein
MICCLLFFMLRIKDLPGRIGKDFALRIVVLLDLLVFKPPKLSLCLLANYWCQKS